MTDQERKESGTRLLEAFQLMFNMVAGTHLLAEDADEATRSKNVAGLLHAYLGEVLKIYPNGQIARKDLRAIGEAFGMRVELVELDLNKARKARTN